MSEKEHKSEIFFPLSLKVGALKQYCKIILEVSCFFKFAIVYTKVIQCFLGGSDGKESACNAGDPGSIPGSGRSPGESHGQRSLTSNSPWGHKEADMTE